MKLLKPGIRIGSVLVLALLTGQELVAAKDKIRKKRFQVSFAADA